MKAPYYLNSTEPTTLTIYSRPPVTNGTAIRSYYYDDASDEWWRSLHRKFDEDEYLQHLWKKARAERLAAEEKMAKAAAREGTRGHVRSHAKPRGEAEKRAALSVRMFAQRVR